MLPYLMLTFGYYNLNSDCLFKNRLKVFIQESANPLKINEYINYQLWNNWKAHTRYHAKSTIKIHRTKNITILSQNLPHASRVFHKKKHIFPSMAKRTKQNHHQIAFICFSYKNQDKVNDSGLFLFSKIENKRN